MPLTDQQIQYMLIAQQSGGTVYIRDFVSSYPLVYEGYMTKNGYLHTITAKGTAAADAYLEGFPSLLATENDVFIATEDDLILEVETGAPDRVWTFLYRVTYPRLNSDNWTFTWEVQAAGRSIQEATIWAEARIEQLFPGATIG